MLLLQKLMRFILAIVLSFALGGAAVARTSHEAHAPQKVFVAGGANSSIVQLCSSKQLVDHSGSPIKIVHISACGMCISGDITNHEDIAPLTSVLMVLVPLVVISIERETTDGLISIPPAAPRASQAPPIYS